MFGMDLSILDDGREARSLLKDLHLQSKLSNDEEVEQAYTSAARLLFYCTIARTAWVCMTQEQHGSEIAKARALPTNNYQAAYSHTLIKHFLTRLENIPFAERVRLPEDADNQAYDTEETTRAHVDDLLNKLWSLLLSDITFDDVPEEGSDASKLLQAVVNTTIMSVELTTKVEIVTMAKILWPSWKLSTTTESLKSFVTDLNNQLEIDGLFSPQEGWLASSFWLDGTSEIFSFSTAALLRKTSVAPTRGGVARARTSVSLAGLETESIVVDEGIEMQVPLGDKRVPIGHVLPVAAEYQTSITSVEEAVGFLDRAKRPVAPEDDDTAAVRANFDRYRRRLYNAMISLPSNADFWQREQWDRYSKSFETRTLKFEYVEANSWLLCEEVIKVQEEGTPLEGHYDYSIPEDNDIKCSDRMEQIIGILHYNKIACADVLESHQLLLRFVTAPNGVMKRKSVDRNTHETAKKRKMLPPLAPRPDPRQIPQANTPFTPYQMSPVANYPAGATLYTTPPPFPLPSNTPRGLQVPAFAYETYWPAQALSTSLIPNAPRAGGRVGPSRFENVQPWNVEDPFGPAPEFRGPPQSGRRHSGNF